MNRIAAGKADERRVLMQEAARRLGLPAAIVEKDFWVCWMLGLLFDGAGRESLVFKGGTTLSKVFGVIRRFSEDIDLSVTPAALNIIEAEVENTEGRGKRDKWMQRLEEACSAWAKGKLAPRLESAITQVLGMPANRAGWMEFERDPASHSPVLLFHYPPIFRDGSPYIRRFVKLELGSLTDQRPAGIHRVRPWLADVLPMEMRDMGCEVVALEVERTFWEKATILHAEHHRDLATPMPERYSRHYADLAALAVTNAAEVALADAALRERVVDWKAKFFARSWARYDLAKPGTFRVLPPDARLAELERDHREMSEMFLDGPPQFADVMVTLRTLESRINDTNK